LRRRIGILYNFGTIIKNNYYICNSQINKIMKICKSCNIGYEDKHIFCPKCHKILYPDVSPKVAPNKTLLEREPQYHDWNPPSPATIYCKIRNIPFDVFKYNRAKGLYSLELRRISD